MTAEAPARAVSFDFGETLATLDVNLLAARLSERGVTALPENLEAALPAAWASYDQRIRAGGSNHPWKHFMETLLEGSASIGAATQRAELAGWLFEEQPSRNLWRRPIPGMIEICEDLARAGVPFGVLSNSEGKLAELIDEMGWSTVLRVVGDSGRLGVEKPDGRIFAWMADRLGTPAEGIVHVGDSRAADVDGALAAGMRAIWFLRRGIGEGGRHARCSAASTPDEVRRGLRSVGIAI